MGRLLGLTAKQTVVWKSVAKGATVSDTARLLGTTKQNVHQTLRIAESVLYKALLEVAEANHLEIKRVDPTRGILWGHHRFLDTDAIITYLPEGGVKVWYWTKRLEEIRDKALLEDARKYLLEIAKQRGISVTEEQRRSNPAKLAHDVFSALLPELKQ